MRAHPRTEQAPGTPVLPTAVPVGPAGPVGLPDAVDPAVVQAMAVVAGWSPAQRVEFIRTVYRYGYAYLRTRDRQLLIQLVNSVLAAVVLHTHPDYLRAIHTHDRPPTQTGEVCR